jgi:hypothetical protein
MTDKQHPNPEQAAAAARVFVKRTRRANRDRLVNTLTQVDAQAGAELREYLADVEPTVPLSAVRELLAILERREAHCEEQAELSAWYGQRASTTNWMARAGEASYAVRRVREIIPAESR